MEWAAGGRGRAAVRSRRKIRERERVTRMCYACVRNLQKDKQVVI